MEHEIAVKPHIAVSFNLHFLLKALHRLESSVELMGKPRELCTMIPTWYQVELELSTSVRLHVSILRGFRVWFKTDMFRNRVGLWRKLLGRFFQWMTRTDYMTQPPSSFKNIFQNRCFHLHAAALNRCLLSSTRFNVSWSAFRCEKFSFRFAINSS